MSHEVTHVRLDGRGQQKGASLEGLSLRTYVRCMGSPPSTAIFLPSYTLSPSLVLISRPLAFIIHTQHVYWKIIEINNCEPA